MRLFGTIVSYLDAGRILPTAVSSLLLAAERIESIPVAGVIGSDLLRRRLPFASLCALRLRDERRADHPS